MHHEFFNANAANWHDVLTLDKILTSTAASSIAGDLVSSAIEFADKILPQTHHPDVFINNGRIYSPENPKAEITGNATLRSRYNALQT